MGQSRKWSTPVKVGVLAVGLSTALAGTIASSAVGASPTQSSGAARAQSHVASTTSDPSRGSSHKRRHGKTPDFGNNVTIFDPSMPVDQINAKLRALEAKSDGFDTNRSAVFFMPGTYGSAAGKDDPATARNIIDSRVGFMETVNGLGASPDDVVINGNLSVNGNLGTFWRGLSNMRINPIEPDESPHTLKWLTSQASPLRRVHIDGDLNLAGNLAFGDFIGNSLVSGQVYSGNNWTQDPADKAFGQAHYYTRDSQLTWNGRAVNFVYTGVKGAPATNFGDWPQTAPGDKTSFATTPVSRDPAFLFVDRKRQFKVFVPHARFNSAGTSWGTGRREGETLPISRFFIAKPGDDVKVINRALARGQNLILTPGVYEVDEPIRVTRPDTVVMGMGLATVTPTHGTAAISVGNVPGANISNLMVDANTKNSDVLVQVGPRGVRSNGRKSDPTTINDVYVRVGGSYAGNATTSIEINQDHVLVDHTWLWRADHGNANTVGWNVNTADHGLVVNGDDVTALALFVEHYQKSQVVWNGERGKTYFMESEAPYDPPTQADYMNGTEKGFPAYEVTRHVRSHFAVGVEIFASFSQSQEPVFMHSAIKAPVRRDVRFKSTTGGWIFGEGGIEHLINDTGGSVSSAGEPPSFVHYLRSLLQLSSYPRAVDLK